MRPTEGSTVCDSVRVTGYPRWVDRDRRVPAGLVAIRRREPEGAVVMMTAYRVAAALAEARPQGARALFATPPDLDRVAAAVSVARELGTC